MSEAPLSAVGSDEHLAAGPPDGPAAEAVRRYLQFLEDPASLRDEAAISELRRRAADARDPLDRLRAISALQDAERVDGAVFEAAFIVHAKAFAQAEGIHVEAFRELGVPADVLRESGLVDGPRRLRPSGRSTPGDDEGAGRTTTPRRSGGQRAPRLPLDEVAAKLPESEFRLTDLAAAIGRETATTRNYLNRLLLDGAVVEVGEDASGRGKPAKIYRRA
jgi:hypothetical protein